MKKGVVIFSVLITLLVACTKEKSIEGGIRQKLLVKTVAKLGTDSLVSLFGYDGNDYLISYSTDAHLQGNYYHSQATFKRDDNGILQQATIDTSVYVMNYDPGAERYTAAITEHTISGQVIKDSTAFTYDATGNLTKAERFFDDGVSGGYTEGFKTEYAYDGDGSVIRATSYKYNLLLGIYEEAEETTYEYDTKVNPLRLGIEAYLLNEPDRASAFNVTKMTTANNETITYAYTYNSESKPDTAAIVYQSSGIPLNATYYYQ